MLVSIEDFLSLEGVLNDFFLLSIDEGEREAISFLYNTKQKNEFLFCTADLLAIKCLGVLGLRYLGISIQELFKKCNISSNLPSRYIQNHSKKILNECLLKGLQKPTYIEKMIRIFYE